MNKQTHQTISARFRNLREEIRLSKNKTLFIKFEIALDTVILAFGEGSYNVYGQYFSVTVKENSKIACKQRITATKRLRTAEELRCV